MEIIGLRNLNVIQVIIADDHVVTRHGLKQLLSTQKDIELVGEAASGEEVLQLLRMKKADIVVMDVKMPGMGGLDATQQIIQRYPRVKVLGLSACNEESYYTHFIKAGASGYLTKGTSLEEMLKAIKAVHAGKHYFSPEIAQKLAEKHVFNDDEESPFNKLSLREIQTVILLSKYYSIEAIAEELHISKKTVYSYRYRIYEKLNVSNDVELTHLAIRYGLVDLNTSEISE